MAALLFHPPHYQCMICQHNASLYRALSNPNIFPIPHTTGSVFASSSTTTTASTAKKRDVSHITDQDKVDDATADPVGVEEESPEDTDDAEEGHPHDDDSEELTPPLPPQLELKRHHRSSLNSIKDSVVEAAVNLRDISGLREPLYTDLKPPPNHTVHWNTLERLERKKSFVDIDDDK